MPNAVINSFAEKTGKSVAEVDKLWNKAKEIAKEAGEGENYAYITGIVKKMLGLNETVGFKEFLAQEQESKEKSE
jgi:hypothetical protein